MIVLITGASHTGKTLLAQRILEKYGYPYLSIDHLKMGLIRSGWTDLTPLSSQDELTGLLWPIVREMIRTALENEQNLTVEGCYIPASWAEDFSEEERRQIRSFCLVMTERYIREHYADIAAHAGAIEKRLDDDCTLESVLEDNARFREEFPGREGTCLLIDGAYAVDVCLGGEE